MTITERVVPVVDRRGATKSVALFFSVVLLAVGILGFVPGATAHLDQIQFLGDASGAMLFGVFQVSILLNLIHVLLGVAGIFASRAGLASVVHLILGGIVLLAICAYGVMILPNTSIDFFAVNGADGWLHLVLGLGMLVTGLYGQHHLPMDQERPVVPPLIP